MIWYYEGDAEFELFISKEPRIGGISIYEFDQMLKDGIRVLGNS